MNSYKAAISVLVFCALACCCYANVNDNLLSKEDSANLILAQAERHCQVANSSAVDATGRRKRDVSEQNLRQIVLRILSDCMSSDGPIPTTPSYRATPAPVSSGPCVSPATRNLTGSWRKDNLGSGIRPVDGNYNCDRDEQNDAIWFRFTGSGGRQMLNTCPPDYSCGSHGGFWTDATMPTVVGEIRSVPIYGSWSGNCKWYTWPTVNALTVQRCSARPGDFVYKVRGTRSCHWTFCGMD